MHHKTAGRLGTRALVTFVAAGLVALAGCDSTVLKAPWGRGTKPVSNPPAEPSEHPGHGPSPIKFANTSNEPAPPSQDGTNDSVITQLDTKIQQYAGRFPQSDLDRKINPTAAQRQPAANTPPSQVTSGSLTPSQRTQVVAKSSRTTGGPGPLTPSLVPPQVPAAQGPAQATPSVPLSPAAPNANMAAANTAVAPHTGPNPAVTLGVASSPQPPEAPGGQAAPTPANLRVELIDIRPAPAPTTRPDTPTAAANQPIDKTAKTESGDITSLIRQLEESVAQKPQQLDDQFKLRTLYLATGQTEKTTAPFPRVDPVQGETLAALFQTMTAVRDAIRDPSGGAAAALAAVRELQRLISEQSPIVINKIALVTSVNSFGDYQAISPARFPAGKSLHVFCYAEIANFHSEPTGDGRLRTLLAAKVEVFDTTGKIVWQQAIPQIEDRVLSPRRDFFVPLEIKLPSGLPAGDYVLKVTINDKLGATTDQQRMTFTMGQ